MAAAGQTHRSTLHLITLSFPILPIAVGLGLPHYSICDDFQNHLLRE
jgi:hypothetical protein